MKNDSTPRSFTEKQVEESTRKNDATQASSLYWVSRLLLILLLSSLFVFRINAQYCGPNVPTFNVNLTGNPNGSWISPNTLRNDNCCGSTNPDVCVQFIVTLDPQSQGIMFNVFSGAMPPGALYYQINCGPPYSRRSTDLPVRCRAPYAHIL